MTHVFLGEDNIGQWQLPVDGQHGVVPRDAPLRLRAVEIVTLVLEDCRRAKHSKAMGHTLRQEKLAVVVSGQQNGYVLAKSGAATTYIDRNIKYATFNNTY